MSTAPATKPSETTMRLQERWGKALIAAGFTALPDVIFLNQKALKLKPLDVVILLHLASYWRDGGSNPWPAKGTLAAAIDVDVSTVRRSIKKMEGLGYVKRIIRKTTFGDNNSNEYDLRGLIAATEHLAKERLELRERRAAEEKAKRETPATFSLIKGGKAKP